MIYQEAGISRYCLGQKVELLEVQDKMTGENIHPASLLYPPDTPMFLSRLAVSQHDQVLVYEQRAVQPNFFGYKAACYPGTSKEKIVTNNYFRYSRSIEFLCGIEPVNLMDYLWQDDNCGRVYVDAHYLLRCCQDYVDLYPHLKSFLET